MLDIKYIRENLEAVKQGAINKRITVDFDRLIELDASLRPKQQELEQLQAQRNQISKSIAKASPSEREQLKQSVSTIKTKMETLTDEVRHLKDELDTLLLSVPQPAREDVPVGKDDNDNVEIKKWGKPPKFDFKIRDHVELGQRHGLIDIERGVKLAGSRSYILKGEGVILEQAVLRFTFDHLVNKGYTPLSVPVLVNEDAMVGTGYFPTGRDQAYYIEKDELALVGTAEVSLTSYHRNEILPKEQLPLRYVAWSPCFRREAGTYGKDTHGLYRVHQFQKIEQVVVCENDVSTSEKHHEELLTNAEEIMQALGLAYRVVYVCTGDLGQGQVRKHDIEAWMPSRNAYSETHSCSTFYEFQARRLKMRYKDSASKQTTYCHTLNNTAIASPRILIPLLENYQTKEGRIIIPEALRPYCYGRSEI